MVRVAIIGLGNIAPKAYLPLLTFWEGFEILLCIGWGRNRPFTNLSFRDIIVNGK